MRTLCQPADGICTQCQTAVPPRLHRTCPAKNRSTAESEASAQRSTRIGIGDLTAEFFATLGITEDRYIAVKNALHLSTTCGCAARKQWLNAVGEKLGINDAASAMVEWLKERKQEHSEAMVE